MDHLPAACHDDAARESLAAFARAAGADPTSIADVYEFGDRPDVVDELAELVVSGPKRATTSLLRWYEIGGERLPVAGDLGIVIASGCRPRALIRVTQVDIKPFIEVDAAFAWDEGEGDRSLASWQRAHRQFFAGEGSRGGFTFSDWDHVVLCRFDVVWPVVERPQPFAFKECSR